MAQGCWDEAHDRSSAVSGITLYRAMAFLGEEIEPKGQKNLSTPRCLKDLIEEEFSNADAICLPKWTWSFSTPPPSTFFGAGESRPGGEVCGGESIGKRGHNKDHRPDLYQMVLTSK